MEIEQERKHIISHKRILECDRVCITTVDGTVYDVKADDIKVANEDVVVIRKDLKVMRRFEHIATDKIISIAYDYEGDIQ